MDAINLNISELNIIFPFFILIDEDLMIIENGTSINKIIPHCKNHLFSDLFTIDRPFIDEINFDNFRSINNQLLILKSNQEKPITFRGQFNYLPDYHRILFIGEPWFVTTNDLNGSDLEMIDYAPHSSIVDMLHIIKNQETVNEELKYLLKSLTEQKNNLIIAQEKLKIISEQLTLSNQRYEYVNKATSEAIWDWNILTGDVFYGDGFNKLFGHEISKEAQNFSIWEERIHPDDFEKLSLSINDFLATGESKWNEEYRYLKKDGSYAFVSDKGFVLRDEQGHALRMIGTIQDISIRKKEEQYLKLMESVIKNANDSVVITEINNDYPIVYINESFTKLTGYSFEEVKGKNPRFLQGPKSDKVALKKIRDALKIWQPCEITTLNYKKNGDAFWLNFSISPITNEKGEYTHWISIERDVTELKKANDEIILQKNFTEDIMSNFPIDVAVFDPNHNYLYVNPYAIKSEEVRKWIINKNDFDYANWKGIDDEIARKRWEYFEDAVEKREKIQWLDEHQSPSGNKTYILRHFSPYFEKNKLKFVIGYGIDITERKKAELNLDKALITLTQTNIELEHFAYVASHDLQEPLRMITSFLAQLEKNYNDKLDDKGRQYIYYAVDGAKRMRQIILDILEYSRIGKTQENLRAIDLNEIVNEVITLHGKQIEELHAIIKKEKLPIIQGYKTPFRQIFQNLISNALKYHRAGVPPEIKIGAKKIDDMWQFDINDNGIGINAEYFDKIFVIFQRLHNKDEYSGTGIGLAIIKKIIESTGGQIWVTSEINKGTTFHFTIPVNINKLS